MSAADPADHTPPPTLNTGDRAPVIDLSKRRRSGAHTARTGRWQRMDTPSTPAAGDDRERVLRLLADDMEKAFNADDGRTLTDEETAAVYVRTLALVEHALDGAAATGLINEGQRTELGHLIAGMKAAPRYA